MVAFSRILLVIVCLGCDDGTNIERALNAHVRSPSHRGTSLNRKRSNFEGTSNPGIPLPLASSAPCENLAVPLNTVGPLHLT